MLAPLARASSSEVNHAAQLASCPLFHGFTETGLQILGSIARERAVRAGETIFAEDAPADSMFVVVTGSVAIRASGAEGRERTLAMLGPGEAFGELALLTPGGRRLVGAVAQEDARLLEIVQRDFARLQTQKPQACLKLILNVAGAFGRKMSDNRALLRSLLLAAVPR